MALEKSPGNKKLVLDPDQDEVVAVELQILVRFCRENGRLGTNSEVISAFVSGWKTEIENKTCSMEDFNKLLNKVGLKYLATDEGANWLIKVYSS